jgi:hypothetical protein
MNGEVFQLARVKPAANASAIEGRIVKFPTADTQSPHFAGAASANEVKSDPQVTSKEEATVPISRWGLCTLRPSYGFG